MNQVILKSDSTISLELPGMNEKEVQRVQEAIMALLDSKFFSYKKARLTFYVRDGFLMKRGIYIEEKLK